MSTLILDQFTDTNGTDLGSHTIGPTNTPSTSWTKRSGSDALTGASTQVMTIQSNACQSNNTGGAAQYSLDAGQADVTISADFNVSSASSGQKCGILFRRQDGNNWWTAQYENSSGKIYIFEISGGSATQRDVQTPGASSTFTMTVTLSGNSIDVTIGGGVHATYSSSDFATATQHGLRCDNNLNMTYDNFTISVADAGGVFNPYYYRHLSGGVSFLSRLRDRWRRWQDRRVVLPSPAFSMRLARG